MVTRKIMSFSLYGSGSHGDAAIRAADVLYRRRAWRGRFHVADDVPDDVVTALIERDAEVVECGRNRARRAIYWRYRPMSDPDVSHTIALDVDRDLTPEIFDAAMIWISRGTATLNLGAVAEPIMAAALKRSHYRVHECRHDAGAVGVVGGRIPDVDALVEAFLAGRSAIGRFDDQAFVNDVLIPAARVGDGGSGC